MGSIPAGHILVLRGPISRSGTGFPETAGWHTRRLFFSNRYTVPLGNPWGRKAFQPIWS
ncbi:hypothetical protein J2T21_003067 [Paeniglutamicibacter psychrophenolicus]|nr:hypothetical protein [Paeniglutamicibacter psychrophenolicus]